MVPGIACTVPKKDVEPVTAERFNNTTQSLPSGRAGTVQVPFTAPLPIELNAPVRGLNHWETYVPFTTLRNVIVLPLLPSGMYVTYVAPLLAAQRGCERVAVVFGSMLGVLPLIMTQSAVLSSSHQLSDVMNAARFANCPD